MTYFREGQLLIIWSMMAIVKVSTVRKTGANNVLWVEHNGNEFCMTSFGDSKNFVVRNGLPQDDHISVVTPLWSAVLVTVLFLSLVCTFFALL